MPSQPEVGVLIPAAGRGERLGGEPKQFRPIAGVPMLLRALRPFAGHPMVHQIVVALPPDIAVAPPAWLSSLAGGRLRLVAGGEARADSVWAALCSLDVTCRVVLVHDAARPLVSRDTIDAVIKAAAEAGAVPAVAVSDTLKQVDPESGLVSATVNRSDLWRAQTPQGFPRELLEEAYRRAGASGWDNYTDEASLVEAAGFPVRVVPGTARNIKVTTASDLEIAEFFAAQ
jgi:2-C-methyl-D-erythritol 4-phosphate cytidylyltransferase